MKFSHIKSNFYEILFICGIFMHVENSVLLQFYAENKNQKFWLSSKLTCLNICRKFNKKIYIWNKCADYRFVSFTHICKIVPTFDWLNLWIDWKIISNKNKENSRCVHDKRKLKSKFYYLQYLWFRCVYVEYEIKTN